MKNLIFLLLLCFSISGYAQNSTYMQWQNYVITPHYDKLQDFGEAMNEHNKMYHQTAATAASVWRVDTGPNVGKWVLSSGPYTFSHMDTVSMADGHMSHWRNTVMPTIAHIEDGGIWRMYNDHSYIPQNMQITKARVVVHKTNSDAMDGYFDAMKKLTEATAQGQPTMARILLDRVGFHNDGRDKVVFIGLNNWGQLDNGIGNVYEEVHGEGTWDLFLEQVNHGIKSSYEEHWTFIPFLSGIGGN